MGRPVTSTGRLMIAVLGGLADVERDLIRTRTAEGRAGKRHAGGTLRRRGGRRAPWLLTSGCLGASHHISINTLFSVFISSRTRPAPSATQISGS